MTFYMNTEATYETPENLRLSTVERKGIQVFWLHLCRVNKDTVVDRQQRIYHNEMTTFLLEPITSGLVDHPGWNSVQIVNIVKHTDTGLCMDTHMQQHNCKLEQIYSYTRDLMIYRPLISRSHQSNSTHSTYMQHTVRTCTYTVCTCKYTYKHVHTITHRHTHTQLSDFMKIQYCKYCYHTHMHQLLLCALPMLKLM